MSSAQDPFYIVKAEIQESIDKLQSTFHQWKNVTTNPGERVHLMKELLTSCESVEWQVDELNKAIAVAARDPAYYNLDETELERRRKWTRDANAQVATVRGAVEAGRQQSNRITPSLNESRQELMRLPNDRPYQAGRSEYTSQDNDEFISSESDRQLLLIKQQDEELDELSASVERIGGIGLTIHEELSGQDRIIHELSLDMDSTSNRLDFVQMKLMRKEASKSRWKASTRRSAMNQCKRKLLNQGGRRARVGDVGGGGGASRKYGERRGRYPRCMSK